MLLKVFGWINIILVLLCAVGACFLVSQSYIFDDELKLVVYVVAGAAAFLGCFSGIFIMAIGDMQVTLRKIDESNKRLVWKMEELNKKAEN